MYYKEDIEKIYKEFHSKETGLTEEEAEKRILKYGKNALPHKKPLSIYQIFFSEFKNPITILLLITVVISFLIGEVIDAIAILIIVLIDVLLGTWEEKKANNTADALQKLVSIYVKVLRNGKVQSVLSENITLGDIVLIESGDKLSADIRLIEAHNLRVDESVLTGESVQVEKQANKIEEQNVSLSNQKNMVFAGTTVVTGRAKGIVIKIGAMTEIGKIAHSIENTKEEKSPLTIRIEKLSKQISMLVLVIALLLTILLYVKKVPASEIFLSVIALTVSAMPEGLSLALTMALTIASNKMAKKGVVVKKLNSVESLGSCTVIASDKTGTLTVNEQTAKKIILANGDIYDVSGVGYDLEGSITGKDVKSVQHLALLGEINNEAILEGKLGDSIDLAFLVLGKKCGTKTDEIRKIEMIPYESENKYSALFYEQNKEIYCTVKGSLETVLAFCNEENEEELKQQQDLLAKEGYRVIAIANGKVEQQENYDIKQVKNLTLEGMVGFIDPIRKEVVSSIKECLAAKIKVLMITGDHPYTAFSIAKSLELTNDFKEVTTGEEVEWYLQKGEKEFDQFVKEKRIFTRVTPLEKLEIVNSLKRMGEFVAVTGDGVNDAPAIQSANIGIAMGSGTDIARETSKMIIMDDNFTSIVTGIEEGRVAYANIRKIVYFLLSCGIAEVLFFALSILSDLPMPLVAIQLLWLNVVTDGIQDLALSFEQKEDSIMTEKPRNPKESIFDKKLLKETVISGLTIGILVYIVWYFLLEKGMDVSIARAYVMTLMVLIQNIHVFNCRSEHLSIFKVPLNKNWFVVFGIIGSILLHIIVTEVDFLSKFLQTSPIPINHFLILFLLSLIIIGVMEIYKKVDQKK